MLKKRLINWIFFGIFCALLPIFIYLGIRYLFEIDIKKIECIPELLFFIVMTSTTCLSDIIQLNNRTHNDSTLQILENTFMGLLIISAVIYGAFELFNIGISETFSINRLFNISLVLSIAIGIIGTIIQIFIAKVEEGLENG